MRFTTTSQILNRVEKQKGFVYSTASFIKKGELEIEVQRRHDPRSICSGCGKTTSVFKGIQVRMHQWWLAYLKVLRDRASGTCQFSQNPVGAF